MIYEIWKSDEQGHDYRDAFFHDRSVADECLRHRELYHPGWHFRLVEVPEQYQVKILVMSGVNLGATITVELEAKNESAAEHRAYSLLKEMDCGTISVKGV